MALFTDSFPNGASFCYSEASLRLNVCFEMYRTKYDFVKNFAPSQTMNQRKLLAVTSQCGKLANCQMAWFTDYLTKYNIVTNCGIYRTLLRKLKNKQILKQNKQDYASRPNRG